MSKTWCSCSSYYNFFGKRNRTIKNKRKHHKNEETKLNSFLFASKKCLWIVNDTQKTLRHFLDDKNVNQKLIYEKIEFVIKTDINFQKLELAIWMHFQR